MARSGGPCSCLHLPASTWEDAAEPGGMQPPAVPSAVFGKTRGKRQRLSRQAWATSDSGELISAGGPDRRKRYFEARVESRASVLEHKTPFFPGNSSAPRSAVETHRPGEILGDNTGGVKGAAEPPAELRAGSASRGAGVGGRMWQGPFPPAPAPHTPPAPPRPLGAPSITLHVKTGFFEVVLSTCLSYRRFSGHV